MNINHIDLYQQKTRDFAIYPEDHSMAVLMYLALGINGEAGEVAEKVKKYYRDEDLDVAALVKEVGDVFWYCCRLLDELDVDASECLQMNLDKLESRRNRGAIAGNGDGR